MYGHCFESLGIGDDGFSWVYIPFFGTRQVEMKFRLPASTCPAPTRLQSTSGRPPHDHDSSMMHLSAQAVSLASLASQKGSYNRH